MRRPQGIVELAEAAAVIPSLQITLDALEQGLDALKASVESCEIALRGQVLLQLRMPRLALGGLVSHVLEDSVGGLVGELEAATQIDELRGDSGIENGVSGGGNGMFSWGRLVLDWLLGSVALIRGALVRGNTLARGRFQGELEDLKGVGVLRGGGCDTECVAGGQSDLT
jgi:hypothetical protein